MNWGRLSPVKGVTRARILAGRTGRAQGSSGPSTWPGERQVRPSSPHPPPSTPGAQRKTQSIPLSPRRWGCVHLQRLQLAAASPASPLPPSRPPSSPPRPPCSHAKDVTAPPSNHGEAAPRAGRQPRAALESENGTAGDFVAKRPRKEGRGEWGGPCEDWCELLTGRRVSFQGSEK